MNGKLLLLGISTDTRYALEYCKLIGVHTIVTDYNPPEKCPEKLLADEYWMIDLKDHDALEARCREEGVTGVYAGNNEFCLDQTKELAKRLGLPFYASDEGWECARDKGRFKKHCMAVGLDVPRNYTINTATPEREVLDQVEYPVIVKPVDACARKGLSLCNNEEELLDGIKLALAFSEKKEIIVERYVKGEGIAACYVFIDGKPVLHDVWMDFGVEYCGQNITCVVRHQDDIDKNDFLEKTQSKVEALFERMNCTEGVVLLQAMREDGKYYFHEMGYRLDGIGLWLNVKRFTGLNPIGFLVDCQLGRSTERWSEIVRTQPSRGTGCIYLPMCSSGTIAAVEGVDEVTAMEGVNVPLQRYRAGDVVADFGNMLQNAFYITVYADDVKQMIQKVKRINETLRILDVDGNDLLIPFADYAALN